MFVVVFLVILVFFMLILIYLVLKNLISFFFEDIECNVIELLLVKEVKEFVVEVEVEKIVEVMDFVEKSSLVFGEEYIMIEVLKMLDFWILFVLFFCGVGMGLMVMNNMG